MYPLYCINLPHQKVKSQKIRIYDKIFSPLQKNLWGVSAQPGCKFLQSFQSTFYIFSRELSRCLREPQARGILTVTEALEATVVKALYLLREPKGFRGKRPLAPVPFAPAELNALSPRITYFIFRTFFEAGPSDWYFKYSMNFT